MANWALVDVTRGGIIQDVVNADIKKYDLPSDPGPGGSILEWHEFNPAVTNVNHSNLWRWDGTQFVAVPPDIRPPKPIDPSPGTFDVLQFLIDNGTVAFTSMPAAWKPYLNP